MTKFENSMTAVPNAGTQADECTGSLFSAAAEQWLCMKAAVLKPSTISRYEIILRNHLLPVFGSRPVSEITRAEVYAFLNELVGGSHAEQNSLSPATAAGFLTVLKSILAYAAQEMDCRVPDLSSIAVKKGCASVQILSRPETERLLNQISRDMTGCNLGILICLYTGIRLGEICALKWGDISAEDQTLLVSRTMIRLPANEPGRKTEVRVTAPKSSRSARQIPLPDVLNDILQVRRSSDQSYVLTDDEERFVEPRTMQYHFKSVLRAAGIDDINFHALRHTFATRCVEIGFDIKSLSEILGHSSVNFTMNRYVHPSMEIKQKNMNRIGQAYPLDPSVPRPE